MVEILGPVEAMKKEDRPLGVSFRGGKPYVEPRVVPGSSGKVYIGSIETVKEAALCHDMLECYVEKYKVRKRKALNYPDYSPTLVLVDLSKEFAQVIENKDAIRAAVRSQSNAEAKVMPDLAHATRGPKLQKHSRQDDKSSSSKKGVCSPSRGGKERLDDHTAYDCAKRMEDVSEKRLEDVSKKRLEDVSEKRLEDVSKKRLEDVSEKRLEDVSEKRLEDVSEKRLEDVSELTSQCCHEFKLKVIEKEELERKVKDMTEDSGIISLGEPGSDKFHEYMACIKQLAASDGCMWSSSFEHNYMLEEDECNKLREKLKGHNMKLISDSLMCDGDAMTGSRREDEWLPPVSGFSPSWITDEVSGLCAPPASTPPGSEIFPAVEQHSCSTDEVSDLCAPPTSTPMPSTMESETVDASALCIEYAIEDVDRFLNSLPGTGYRREDEKAYFEEASDEEYFFQVIDRNNKQEFQDQQSLDWTDTLFPSFQG